MKGLVTMSALGMVVLVIFVVVLGGIFWTQLLGVQVKEKSLYTALRKVPIAHQVRDCLGGDSIAVEFLEENKGKNVCDLCTICEMPVEASVRTLDGKREWRFDYNAFLRGLRAAGEFLTVWKSEKHASHEIAVLLVENEHAFPALLEVEI